MHHAGTIENEAVSASLWTALACMWLLLLSSVSLPSGASDGSIATSESLRLATRALVGLVLLGVFAGALSRPTGYAVIRLCLPLLLFVGFAVASIGWSPLKSVSLWQAGSLAVLMLLAMSLASRHDSQRNLSLILCNLSCLLLAYSVTGLAMALGSGVLERGQEGGFHTTSAGASASLGVIILTASSLFWSWPWSRWLAAFGVPIHCLVLYIAVNRVSICMTLAVTALLFFCVSGRSRTVTWAMCVVASVAGCIYLGLDPGLDRAERLIASTSTYASREQSVHQLLEFSGRWEMWGAIWDEYVRSPLIGHGYFVCSPDGEIYVWRVWGNWSAHNVVLQCLMSVGLVGLTLLLWGFARVSKCWLESHANGSLPPELSKLFALLSVWTLGWGMFNESFLGPTRPQSIALFVLFGLAIGELVARTSPAGESHNAAALLIAGNLGARVS